MLSTQARHNDVLFVGSLAVEDAEAAFRLLAGSVGDRAKRYPDGEPGPRKRWIMWQAAVLDAHPQFQHAEEIRLDGQVAKQLPIQQRTLKAGIDPADVVFSSIGYAEEALKSYAIFRRLKKEGVIPSSVRFQVSLPTPTAFVVTHIAPALQLKIEPLYEQALRQEIRRMEAEIPATELAIQWDVAHEIVALDGGMRIPYTATIEDIGERLSRLAGMVPAGAELGIHFCYGDPGHKHIVEPRDLTTCVKLANALAIHCPRPIEWIHMPVPRDRNDDAFFAPLDQLHLKAHTELYLGLIHLTDGVPGAVKRIAAAEPHATAFGIATECGFGRRPPDTVPRLLEIHATLAGRR